MSEKQNPKPSPVPPELKKKASRLPTSPGVYIMKDARSRILYIGKAVNLRRQVRSYFGRSNDGRPFIRPLLKRIDDLDCIWSLIPI